MQLDENRDFEQEPEGTLKDGAKSRNQTSIYDLLEEDIMRADMPESEKTRRLSQLIRMRRRKANIMLAGATGSGKSSTINALFNMEVAEVGVGVDPETDKITSYVLENLTIWDTPGLGDGVKADEKYNRMITRKLNEVDENNEPLIDAVLVVLDASSKDLGTSYDLINNVIIPCLGEERKGRVLIGLNQSDLAMKGKHWNAEKNEPDEVLADFLKKKADSVQQRIADATGISIRPICYCAGYKEEGGEQCKPYNMTKLFYYLVQSIPVEKRAALIDHINSDKDVWLHDDKGADYRNRSKMGLWESITFWMDIESTFGANDGEKILGTPGRIIGHIIGGGYGAVKGLFRGIFGADKTQKKREIPTSSEREELLKKICLM